jgi:Fe-S oxidoreductase
MSWQGMTAVLLIGFGTFAVTARKRWRLMFVGCAPLNRGDRSDARIGSVVRYMFGQLRMFRYKGAGIAHAMIFAGFVILGLRTLILVARGYSSNPGFGFWIFNDGTILGGAYNFLKDLIGIAVIAGVAFFFYLRLIKRPARMELSTEGIVILCMILGLIVCDLSYEAGGMVIAGGEGGPSFHFSTPFASIYAQIMRLAPPEAASNLHTLGFWGHSILVLAFLNVLPHGKHFHILTVLPNVFARNLDGIGRLRKIDDIEGRLEREESLGVKTARDLSWKDVLDFYTCTECGRCSDHCPAFNTGKLLSPKHLTMQMRDEMYARQDELIAGAGRRAQGARDGSDTESSSAREGHNEDCGAFTPFVPQTVDPEMLWACTTCGACEQECPVFITYVDKIVDMRRNLVMEQGEFPAQLQNAFRGLETVGNPYSAANETRADWAEGLGVPLRSAKPDAEYLYWVGCAPSFDDRSRKIARAFARLMQRAGVDFAILGPEEMCNGDPARRAGNEYLFERLAQQNIETLSGHNVRKIVTTCPHCFNTLANEYPDFGGNYEVIHHSDLLAKLLRDGRLKPVKAIDGTVVYHDSCYIGRYNDIYDPPREILQAIPGLRVVEAVERRDRGMCCGAGGAQMWKEDEEIRRPGSREGDGKVNHARTNQLLRVLPSGGGGSDHGGNPGGGVPRGGGSCGVATACPFCKTMLSDGLNDKERTDVQQRDVAEYLWEAVGE